MGEDKRHSHGRRWYDFSFRGTSLGYAAIAIIYLAIGICLGKWVL